MNGKTIIMIAVIFLIGYAVGMKKPGIIPLPGM